MLTIESQKMLKKDGVFVCVDHEVIVQMRIGLSKRGQQCDGDGFLPGMSCSGREERRQGGSTAANQSEWRWL